MSDTLGSYNYTPEHIRFIQQEIKNYLECDDVLSEYIIVMVRNNKTKKEISGDLADFLSSDSESFVNWLWNFIRTYFVQKESSSVAPAGDTATDPKKSSASRLLANAVKQATDDTKNVVPNDMMEFSDDATDSSYSNGYKNRSNNNNNNNNKSVKPSKYNNTSNRSTSSPPSSLKVTFSTSPSDRKRKINTSIDEELIDRESPATEDDPESSRNKKKTDKKERCPFWPQCKNGDSCPSFHPTIQCNLFPKCPYGEKCLYIHPSIPCKFGTACTNFNCPYNHPLRSMQPVFESSHSGFSIPCRNGFACTNKKFCSFSHPPLACKYGEACAFGKKCTYSHGKPCKHGVACTTPSCIFAHSSPDAATPINQKECKFGKECTNVNCKYLHADRENIEGLSSTLPSTPPQEQEDAIIADAITEPIVPEVTF